ncbi:MAG: dicarboxylate/amino acid:cation symporter [Desulfurococcaceae archaeon]
MTTPPRGYRILIGIAVGFVLGLIIGSLIAATVTDKAMRSEITAWFKAFGDIFVRLIRIVIPFLIFFTISAAISSIASARRLGLILAWLLILYVSTSILAAAWGVLGGVLFTPGSGIRLELPPDYKPPKPPTGIDILLSFFATDFSTLLTVGGSMSMIIFAIILGVSVVLLGEEGRFIAKILSAGSRLAVSVVRVIMFYAPIAVFCYAVWLMAEYGPAMLAEYAKFLGVQYGFSLFHFFFIYAIIVSIGGLNPLRYFKIQSTPFIVAFTTRSSAVTLPYNLEAAKRMGVSEEVYNITLPIGATVNMDGTALYQALSAMFIAQLFGIPLAPYQYGLLIFAALIGSIATAAIPGGGVVMLAYVLSVVGLPLEGIALMLVIDPLADAIRTAINVSGDNACTVLIDKRLLR